MKNRIIVGGKTLQLEDKDIINLNIQINDISNISTRNSSYSNTINVPKNSHNQEILDMVGVMGSTTRYPYQKIPCKYFREGIAIINNGYLQITDITDKYFKVVLYDGIIELSQALDNKKLTDLNALVQYNHTLSETVYTNSFSNTSGYIYCVADYGVNRPTYTVVYPLEYQVPSLYVHSLIDDILTEAGFTYEGNIFTDTDYLSLIVAPTNGYETSSVSPTVTPLRDFNTNTIADVQSNEDTPSYDGGQIYYYNHTLSLGTGYNSGVTLIGGDTIRSDFDGRMEIDIDTTFDINHGDVIVYLRKNGSVITQVLIPNGTPDGTESYSVSFPVATNDEITMDVSATETFFAGTPDTYRVDFDISSTLSVSKVVGGQYIDFNILYGDVLQSSVLKDVMQHYGLLLTKSNTQDNLLRFVSMEELLQDKSNAEDWTDKLVEITNESFSVDGYAKVNNFKYKYESGIDVFDFDGEMLVDNEHIQDEQDLIKSIFKIRESNYISSQEEIHNIPLWETKTEDSADVNSSKKTDLTLFKKRTVNETIRYNVYGGATTIYSATPIPTIDFTNVDYQYYIDNYYTELKSLLDNNKRITVKLNLTNVDVAQLDFFKLKYLKQTGRYYYLNSVKSRGDITTAELIEINN